MKRFMHWAAMILIELVLTAGCAAQVTPTPKPTAAPSAAQTETPVIAPTNAPEVSSHTLTVFAAASLTESFGELGKQFEAAHPGVKVLFNFASSQQLRAQLEQGAQADAFASANTKEMNSAIGSGLVILGTQKVFARNRLIAMPPGAGWGRVERAG